MSNFIEFYEWPEYFFPTSPEEWLRHKMNCRVQLDGNHARAIEGDVSSEKSKTGARLSCSLDIDKVILLSALEDYGFRFVTRWDREKVHQNELGFYPIVLPIAEWLRRDLMTEQPSERQVFQKADFIGQNVLDARKHILELIQGVERELEQETNKKTFLDWFTKRSNVAPPSIAKWSWVSTNSVIDHGEILTIEGGAILTASTSVS